MCRIRKLRIALALVTSCGLSACASAPSHPPRDLAGELDRAAGRWLEKRKIPGLSIAILDGDRPLYVATHGEARLDPSLPVSRETRFDIASISKTFTATATMTLVERGLIALEDPVARWLPELESGGELLRVRHLLTQTSGLPELFSLPGYPALVARTGRTANLPAVLAEIARAPRRFAPGERWGYSNSNYAALALLVERASGMPYGRFLGDEVLAPLNLGAIRACAEIGADEPGPAPLYRVEAGAFVPFSVEAERHLFTGYGELCATAEELARFFSALATGRIVSGAGFARMTAPSTVAVGGSAPYGFGLSLRPIAGLRAISHTGSSGTAAAYFPESATTIVVLSNRDLSFAEQAVAAIARVLWELPEPPPLDPRPPEAAEMDRFTGRFDDGLFRFEIVSRDGALWLDNPPFGAPRRLARERDGRWVSVEDPEGIAFELPPPGSAPGADLLFDWSGFRSFARRLAE